jgi:hypothetical protein
MSNVILTGASIFIYLNNKLYGPAQQMQYTIDSQDQEIYGVDSFYPQEIAPSRGSISGSISGLRVRNSGGLVALGLRSTAAKPLAGNYVSIRIRDRLTGEDIIFIQQAKITSEQNQVSAKGTYKLSFNFKGIVGLSAPDRGIG